MFKIISAVLLSLLFFCSCSNYKQIECTAIKGFQIKKIDPKGIDATILLELKNPNPMGFTVYKSEFDVTYSGVYLGKAKLLEKVKINGNEEKIYGLNLQGDFKNVNLMDVLKLLGGAAFKNEFEVKGDLRAGKFFIKKRFPINIKEKISLN